ncbi:CBS-HotDog domain-containing transcription factor SpxR [Streptococcus hillyeri]|uniref:CBS domain-containing protein n=1 Tax=Streptococcus hillyeri TaxID=2282420 RepID=A0A3L9E004_9STRE|nr:CBS-HotDog domain-containing transcription factor SpxR [Streptococcus hillyeri]RLY04410.1 CBS domain-containing protein [Streptococcus hillyeri]
MSKHQEILDYLENLAVGKRVSVRSISNHLKVSDGTAYRAIKEAENRGIVETRPRSGTVRVDKKMRVRLDRLTYAEIARISDSDVVAGAGGLGREFSKFSIGAMTRENILRYLVNSGLLIVGDREDIQLLALEHQNAVLVTGGFSVSAKVKEMAEQTGIPVMVTGYDTFSVATMINQALSNARIKTDVKTVDEIYQFKSEYGYLQATDTVKDFHHLTKKTNHVRFPVTNADEKVVGVVSMRDVAQVDPDEKIETVMTSIPFTTKPSVSLANISQKMIFEDYNMVPVVADDLTLLGVITRRQILEGMQNLRHPNLHTYSEQMLAHLHHEKDDFSFVVEPVMLDHLGQLAQGVLAEYFKEVAHRILTKKSKKNVIIDQMMIYFLEAVQIDDHLTIVPKVVMESRRSSILDIDIYLENQMVAKAMVTTKTT